MTINLTTGSEPGVAPGGERAWRSGDPLTQSTSTPFPHRHRVRVHTPNPAGWRCARVEPTSVDESPRGWILVPGSSLDGAGDTPRPVVYVTPASPALVRGSQRSPMMVLTLILSRPPAPEDPKPGLVEEGILTLQLNLGTPERVLHDLGEQIGSDVLPLYAHGVTFALLRVDGTELARPSDQAHGTSPRGVLSAVIGPADSRRFLLAVDGEPSGLCIETRARFHTRAAEPPPGTHRLGLPCGKGDAANSSETSLLSRVPLEDVVGGALVGQERERFVRVLHPCRADSETGSGWDPGWLETASVTPIGTTDRAPHSTAGGWGAVDRPAEPALG